VLRLVRANDPPFATMRTLAITLVAVEDELADYIEQRLRKRWPGLQVRRTHDPAEMAASLRDIVISSQEPDIEPVLPTLWLSDVERRSRPFQVGIRLWKCATPISGAHLVTVIDHMARSIPP
jgi:hypothetical protein